MGDRTRKRLLASRSRVSKETKLRLRVLFLDESERTFEVEREVNALLSTNGHVISREEKRRVNVSPARQ
ncbi:hypothetical protein JOQ06_019739 [Pogonophryne albipinna]|uniref:Uncharacterized protein n=1 Tax=Pogonophryne albipinna TaxID=1090488 RepID=A0AAD6BQX1_9TELE|nr:hypothetical protein JOQ06_019739 [Pogonophryne albipinna]